MDSMKVARQVAELVQRIDALMGATNAKAQLSRLRLPSNGHTKAVPKRVSKRVRMNLEFARALKGLPPQARHDLVMVKEQMGVDEAVKTAERLRNISH